MALETWVMVPGWDFLDRYTVDAFLDRLQEAGVRAVAFGGTPPVEPDRELYRECGIEPLPPPPQVMKYASSAAATIEKARERGMGVYLYGTNPHMSSLSEVYGQLSRKVVLDVDLSLKEVESYWGACVNCPRFLAFYRARLQDTYRHFPCDGFLNDGPEFGYEIDRSFMGGNWDMFSCFGPCCARKAGELGCDLKALQEAAGRLRKWFRNLGPALVEELAQEAGLFDALDLLLADPDLGDWLRFKTESVESYVQALCAQVKSMGSHLQMGVGSRTAAFAPLTGYNLSRIARHADFLLPKLYLWMGGYDGLYGTIYRWVKTLKEWNPGVSEESLFRFVYRLFGVELPQICTLRDMTRHIDDAFPANWLTYLGDPFPDAFYSGAVASETRKAIQRVGDASRVRPWVCTHHGGRVLTPQELHLLLAGAEQAGLTTYLYYCSLEGGEWEVARKHALGSYSTRRTSST